MPTKPKTPVMKPAPVPVHEPETASDPKLDAILALLLGI